MRDYPGGLTRSLRALWYWYLMRGHFAAGLIAAGVGLTFGYRVYMALPEAEGPLLFSALVHDSALWGVMLLLYGASLLATKLRAPVPFGRVLGVALRGTALLVAVIYAADVLAFRYFHTRLYVQDLVEYGGEIRGGLSFASSVFAVLVDKPIWKFTVIIVTGVVASASATAFLIGRHRTEFWLGIGILGTGALLIGASQASLPAYVASYNNKRLYENVFERNVAAGRGKPYSADFKQRLLTRFKDVPVCGPGNGHTPQLILIFVEGLSSYQSRLFSGLNDFTPTLDSLALSGFWLPNFFANGWTTRGGLIALLTGTVPVMREGVRGGAWGSPALEDFVPSNSLPKVLAPHGYRTAFLTTGNLSFTNKGPWLRSIGFDTAEGHNAKDYDGFPRTVFDAAPDSALYLRAMRAVRAWSSKPLALVLETVSSHQPWRSVDGGADDEEDVIRYTDRQLGIFRDSLSSAGYFAHGILIIVGDHRAMTPLSHREWERYGRSAVARVPLVVVGDGIRAGTSDPRAFQQIDLLPSLESVVSSRTCRSPQQGWFLGPHVVPPPFVIHAMGEDRDLLYVRSDSGEAIVRTEGDATHVVWGHVARGSAIIDAINYERIRQH